MSLDNFIRKYSTMERERTKSIAIALVFAFGYFAAWSLLASPFVAFPGDDVDTIYILVTANGATYHQSPLLESSSPVYYMLAYLIQNSCSVLTHAPGGCDAGDTILHLAIASNAVITLLIGLILFRLTKNLYVQSTGHLIYAFAAWPVTYHFMVSYTVTTTALVLLALYLIILSSRRSHLLLGFAGVIAGFALWTSPSGPLTVGLLLVTVGILLWKGNSWHDLLSFSCFDVRRFGIFVAGFLVVCCFFGYFGLQHYLDHLIDNINTPHHVDAYKKFGSIPASPFFSYLYILKVYGNVGLLVFIATLLAIFIMAVSPVSAENNKKTGQALTALTIFIVLHALLIDILPSTKLARTHFPSYPISIIVICLTGFAIFKWLIKQDKEKRLATIFLSVTLIAMIYDGARISKETRYVRTTAEKYIANTREITDWFLLSKDPHSGVIWVTSNWTLIDEKSIGISTDGSPALHGDFKPGRQYHALRYIEASIIPALLANTNHNQIGLVLGPRGHGSGLSLAKHASFDDFIPETYLNIEALRPQIKEVINLPYYMHYPPFLLEEEISQALYFSGNMPDYRMPEMGITLIRF